jgi:two-component system NarL family sensor kinase
VSVGPGVERLSLSPPVAHNAYFLVHEAVVNAGRHSGARSIRVDLAPVPGGLRLDVADDGRGFPFRGRLDQAALAAAGVGPRSLRERIEALGGTLAIDSTKQGSRVEMWMPVSGRVTT